jgi:hypothetical protein
VYGDIFTFIIIINAVGIMTDNWLDGRGAGVRVVVGASFSFLNVCGLSPRVKKRECEADHLPTSNAEIKNTWSLYVHPHTP